MERNYLFILALLCSGISIGQNTEERYTNQIPNNTLENPSSYASVDRYKVAKAKNAMVYGRDYIFDGYTASDVDSTLIEQVDPYNYLNYIQENSKVYIDVQDLNLTLILFPRNKKRTIKLNEND